MKVDTLSVVLTGATGGIGAAMAHELNRRGARLVLVGRNSHRLQALSLALHPDTLAVQADLNTRAGRDSLACTLREQAVQPSILINNAGVSGFRCFDDQSDEQIEHILHTNLVSPVLLTRSLLPLLTGPTPRVVNIGSTFGSIGYPGFSTYSASKFGLRGFSEALARELADSDVTVQYAAPRATRTALNSPAVNRLNKRLGTRVDNPEDVANHLVNFIESGKPTLFVGWPEKAFVRLNAVFSTLVSRGLRGQLATIKHCAQET